MNDTLQKILAFCKERVAAGDIYVWGGSGTKAASITEAWIREKESVNQNGAHADQAVATWKKRLASGKTAFRAYDCSGYISAALMSVGALDKRRDCDGLWARCNEISTPVNGALLFRVSSSDSEDETHVGIYFNGYQYHAKGREDGVVSEPYTASFWAKIGWVKKLDAKEVSAASEQASQISTVSSDAESVDDLEVVCQIIVDGINEWCNVRSGPGLENSKIGKAYVNEVFDVFAVEEEWYKINFHGVIGYIYFELVSEVRDGNT